MSNYDEKLELWIELSVRDFLISDSLLSGVAFQFPGMELDETESLEEWVYFTQLNGIRTTARKSQFSGLPIWQASCYSKFAQRRADKKPDAPRILAGKVRKVLGMESVKIIEVGETVESEVGRLHFTEGNIEYQGRVADRSDVHVMILTFDSILHLTE